MSKTNKYNVDINVILLVENVSNWSPWQLSPLTILRHLENKCFKCNRSSPLSGKCCTWLCMQFFCKHENGSKPNGITLKGKCTLSLQWKEYMSQIWLEVCGSYLLGMWQSRIADVTPIIINSMHNIYKWILL